MLYVLMLLVLVASIALLTSRARRQRGGARGSLATAGLRASGHIALFRLCLFAGGLALYNGHADWRQAVGDALLVVNSVAEFALAASSSSRHPGPPLLVAAFIVLTSTALGYTWTWIRLRPPFGG